METVRVFKPRKKSAWFFILFGSVTLMFGGAGTAYTIETGFDSYIFGDWVYLIFILQGDPINHHGNCHSKKGRVFRGLG
jgi:hypothetical protein